MRVEIQPGLGPSSHGGRTNNSAKSALPLLTFVRTPYNVPSHLHHEVPASACPEFIFLAELHVLFSVCIN
jgi:hypothetical protein